jgi:hypothetical protein
VYKLKRTEKNYPIFLIETILLPYHNHIYFYVCMSTVLTNIFTILHVYSAGVTLNDEM